MHKNATKCNETLGKWCKNKHGASKIIDTFETYQLPPSYKGFVVTHNQIGTTNTITELFAKLKAAEVDIKKIIMC
jgi:hypothetical protein